MKQDIQFGLKAKFIAVFTLLIIVVMVAVSAIIINREEDMITRKMEENGVVLLRSLANACAGPLMQSDYQGVKSMIQELKSVQSKINISTHEVSLKSSNKKTSNSTCDIAYAYIIEEHSKMIAAHINNIGKENLENMDLNKIPELKNDPVMIHALTATEEVIFTPAVIKGKNILDLALPIEYYEQKYGTIRIGLDLSRMEAEITETKKHVLFIGLIAILLAGLVSLVMANIILKPVYALVKGTEKVAVGEFQHKIPVLSSDELGLLARTFNRMTFNISVLYNVSNAMNFISDSDKLLNIILDKALEALHAERGSLMLLDGEDETLMVKVIRGLDEKAAGYIKIKVGEGVAGHVAATGEPLVISSGDEDERFKKFQEWINRSRISSLLCVPLKIEDKVIGVINMVNKHEGEHFNENDIKLMMVLASQAAVTLSKAKLYEDSITDGMTKLFIHRYFQARLDDELKRARRYKTRLSLVMFDIDHFKSFNDTYGHQQGDIVIQDCANVIRASIREHIDIAARYGGEEFAIIMPETGPEGAQVLAERLRIAIEEHEFPGQEKPLHVTVSLGISTFPEDAVEKNMIIKLADEALYAAKEAGRNNVQIYSLLPKSEG